MGTSLHLALVGHKANFILHGYIIQMVLCLSLLLVVVLYPALIWSLASLLSCSFYPLIYFFRTNDVRIIKYTWLIITDYTVFLIRDGTRSVNHRTIHTVVHYLRERGEKSILLCCQCLNYNNNWEQLHRKGHCGHIDVCCSKTIGLIFKTKTLFHSIWWPLV